MFSTVQIIIATDISITFVSSMHACMYTLHTATMTRANLPLQAWSDPQHKLRNCLNDEGLIDIKISGGKNFTDSGSYKVHPKIKEYKWGVAQPGVLCVNSDRKPLYAWAINPSFVSCTYHVY